MNSINFQDILHLLEPGSGQAIIWSFFLYIIFFFGLITLFTMPDKNMIPTLLIAGVLLFAVVAKLSVAAIDQHKQVIIAKNDFGMFVINVGMFVFPLIAIGMARARKNKATIPAIITSFAGGSYFFLYWLVVQGH